MAPEDRGRDSARVAAEQGLAALAGQVVARPAGRACGGLARVVEAVGLEWAAEELAEAEPELELVEAVGVILVVGAALAAAVEAVLVVAVEPVAGRGLGAVSEAVGGKVPHLENG